MKKVRIAHIGCNLHSHATQIFSALAAQPGLFEIVGYALPEDERETAGEKRCATFAGYREMTVEEILSDATIDAVTVETEELRLTRYARMALAAGKHVHMEKPGGIDLGEFKALIREAKASGKILHLGYMYRYNPAIREVLSRARRGELGEIYSVEAQMSCHHRAPLREFLGRYPGGMMFYLGCHLIDLILQLQGAPEKVIPCNTATGIDGVVSEDCGIALLCYPHGVSLAKTCAAEFGGFRRRQLVISSSRETVEIRPLEYGTEAEMYTDVCIYREHRWSEVGCARTVGPFDRYHAMMQSFGCLVAEGRENPYTPDYELLLYRTLLAACGIG